MGKYDRIVKRKEERKAEREKERKAKKDKKTDQDQKKPKAWRKDKGGNYIYKNAIRFSIMSLVAMILVIGFISTIAKK